MQRAGAQPHVLCRERVTTIGLNTPGAGGFVPVKGCDSGVQKRVIVQSILPGYALAVCEDLRRMGIFFRRHMPGLFQQRHVDHRRCVTLSPRVPVPVPGTAEITRLVDDSHVANATLRQTRAGDKTGKTTTDKREGDVIALWLPCLHRQIRVVEKMRELVLQALVLGDSVWPQTLVAFFTLLALEGCFIGSASHPPPPSERQSWRMYSGRSSEMK